MTDSHQFEQAVLPAPDGPQQAVLDSAERALAVLGAPGSGRSTLAMQLVEHAVTAGTPLSQCLVLAPRRTQAAHLRDQLSAALKGTTSQPVCRTPAALAFGILRQEAALHGEPAPRLITGAEQDAILAELLRGHAEEGRGPRWPEELSLAVPTRGFRNELRDLLMRVIEFGVDTDELSRMGASHARPEWIAAAAMLEEYLQVTALARPADYDPAAIIGSALDLLSTDPVALDRARAEIRLLVVDDAQDLTEPAAQLIEVIAGTSIRVRLIGDPDSAVETFRGADPGRWLRAAERLGAAAPMALGASHRAAPELASVGHRVASHIGALATAHRVPGGARPEGGRAALADAPSVLPAAPAALSRPVSTRVLSSPAREGAYVADVLRRAHLLDGIPWNEMAVITRTRQGTGALRRALDAAGVPVSLPPGATPLRNEPAVAALLRAVALAARVATGHHAEISEDDVTAVLSSVYGGVDALSLRQMRRRLRSLDRAGAIPGRETGDLEPSHPSLLVRALLTAPATLLAEPVLAPLGSLAAVIGRAVETVPWDPTSAGGRGAWRSTSSGEELLWAVWEAFGRAEVWRQTALRGGVAGAHADRDLDAVLSLFAVAEDLSARKGASGPEALVAHVLSQSVSSDSLVTASDRLQAVDLLTAQTSAAREWSLVVVAGVQEGLWPNTRLRGTLLGAEDFRTLAQGKELDRAAAASAVRHDELRQFHVAVTRARQRLVVTAVADEDSAPSPYLRLVEPGRSMAPDPDAGLGTPLGLREVVARVRREVVAGAGVLPDAHHDRRVDPVRRDAAIRRLARLAAAGIGRTHPDSWWITRHVTSTAPRLAPGSTISLSPSKVEGFATCPLRWMLLASGADAASGMAANVGILIHEIAAAHPEESDPDVLVGMLDALWEPRGFASAGWVGRRQRHQAEEMLRKYAKYVATSASDGWRVLGVERSITALRDGVRISGTIDRIEQRPDGSVRLVDLKSGKSVVTKPEGLAHPQLAVYQVAVETAGVPGPEDDEGRASVEIPAESVNLTGAHLVYVGTDNTDPPLRPQPALRDMPDEGAWVYELLAACGSGMGGAEFRATPGRHCDQCPVKSSCPADPSGMRLV